MKLAEYRKVQAYVTSEESDGALFADFLLDELKTGRVIEFSHIPSSLYTPYIGTLRKMKRQGWRKGMPDYFIVTRQNVVFVELKKASGGQLSPEQKIWIQALENTGKVKIARCNGFHAAVRFMQDVFVEEETSTWKFK